MSTQDQILSAFEQFCKQSKFAPIALGKRYFLTGYCGQNGKWQVFFDIEGHLFRCCSALPVMVPQQKQSAVMEYLTRANLGLFIGNFELDLRDGEMCYKTAIDVADGELTPGMIKALVSRNLHTTDHYLKGLLQVLIADQEPALAIRAIEATGNEESDTGDLAELLDEVDLDQLSDPGDD